MENRTKQELSTRIKSEWSNFGKYREIFLDSHLPMSLKGKVFKQCVLPVIVLEYSEKITIRVFKIENR